MILKKDNRLVSEWISEFNLQITRSESYSKIAQGAKVQFTRVQNFQGEDESKLSLLAFQQSVSRDGSCAGICLGEFYEHL